MRDIYYQPVGNTMQMDRLPASRPAVEIMARQTSPAERRALVAMRLTVSVLLPWAVLSVYHMPGISILEPFDWIFATPLIVAVVLTAITTKTWRPLLTPAFLVSVFVICLNHRIHGSVQIGVIAASTVLIVMSYGGHMVAIMTVPPVPRERAVSIRNAARLQLTILAAIMGLMVAAALRFNSSLPGIGILLLPLVAIFMPGPRGFKGNRFRICWQCVESWLSYESSAVPGILQSPAGDARQRTALTLFVAGIMGIVCARWLPIDFIELLRIDSEFVGASASTVGHRHHSWLSSFWFEQVPWIFRFLIVVVVPAAIPLTFIVSITMPVLLETAAEARAASAGNETESIVSDVRSSPDPVEKQSLYLGRIVADSSPVLVPRKIFSEHAHGLGDSGSGKTSLFLCPIIEQLVNSGDCSVIVLDLKADTHELLASLESAAQKVRDERGVNIPLKYFSNQPDRATFGFNPMTQPYWSNFDLLTRTDILCGANGLSYGSDYGQGYYSSANAAVLHQTLRMFPHVSNFRELAEGVGTVLTAAKKRDLHPEIRKAGVHVQEVIKRLAACDPLNVTHGTEYPQDVIDNSIDLTRVFQEPQLLYFHLSATLSPSGAPEIARLFTYMLLAAATQVERKHPVFVVVDEFQRMVASNLEYMLQLARSMGVGFILANQCMEDLKKSTTNLIPAIETNCRLRQWFSVSSREDQERLIRSSGETIDVAYGSSTSQSKDGTRTSYSASEKVVNRFTLNDVLLTSDHPFRSILRISRGEGYAQYGGLPVILESQYHISAEEYGRRQKLTWPSLPGSYVPQVHATQSEDPSASDSRGPIWSQETIGQNDGPTVVVDDAEIDEFFDGLRQTLPPHPGPDRRSES